MLCIKHDYKKIGYKTEIIDHNPFYKVSYHVGLYKCTKCGKEKAIDGRNDFKTNIGNRAEYIYYGDEYIPKKVINIRHVSTHIFGECPNCGREFIVDYYNIYKKCPSCNQLLDWSELK